MSKTNMEVRNYEKDFKIMHVPLHVYFKCPITAG